MTNHIVPLTIWALLTPGVWMFGLLLQALLFGESTKGHEKGYATELAISSLCLFVLPFWAIYLYLHMKGTLP